jgi:hypothetical protein
MEHLQATRFNYRLSPVRLGRGLAVAALGMLVLIVAAELLIDGAPGLLDALYKLPPATVLGLLIGMGALIGLLVFVQRQAAEAYLSVDDQGLECRPHRYHGARYWTRARWRSEWRSIQRVVIYRPESKAASIQSWMMATMVVKTDREEYRLGYMHWEPEAQALDRPDLTSLRVGKRLSALSESHPLIELLERRGIPVTFEPLNFRAMRKLSGKPRRQQARAEEEPVDLLSYRSLQLMLGACLVLVIAAMMHYLLLPPLRPLWSPEYGVAVFAGALVCMAGFFMATRPPVRERAVVAVLLGALVGALWHPLSLRTSVLWQGESETVAYRFQSPGRFEPPAPGFPDVILEDLDIPEYWESLGPGQEHEFVLIRISGERFVLSLTDFFDRTSDFYKNRNADD